MTHAGVVLADCMRAHLAESGFPADLHVSGDATRIVVGTTNVALHTAERGSADMAPTAPMTRAARQAAPAAIQALAYAMQEALR